jgi:mannose-6-phosphate isomerase-like protein (cupin superfamily)
MYTMRKLIVTPVLIAAASLLTISLSDDLYAGTGSVAEDETLFAERPVPGVRIIRKADYPKRPAHYLSSSLYTTLTSGRESGRRYTAFDFQTPVGGGPLAHSHQNEWEGFFVQQGMVTFTVGVDENGVDQFLDVYAPTLVYGPVESVVHGFRNNSGAPARIFSFTMPAGLDVFFATSGTKVNEDDYYRPIPMIDEAEEIRTAFWAEQRGDGLHIEGTPGPEPVPGVSKMDVISSPDPVLNASYNDGAVRPTSVGRFGEEQTSLLTPQEAGNITGATAFCGPGPGGKRRPGGTVDYHYYSLPFTVNGGAFPPEVTSDYVQVFYTLEGYLSVSFEGGKRTTLVPPLTFIEIQPGVKHSITNKVATTPAKGVHVSVIPDCDGLISGGVM